MPKFNYSFTVKAPRSAVLEFHRDTSVLKTLTPPPIFVQLHDFEPLADGSRANFTLWFGPFPIRWQAVHSDVGENGFTDTQVFGPLKSWKHQHQFIVVNEVTTEVREHIEYEYSDGLTGLMNRFMYSRATLYLLFTARSFITRKKVSKPIP